MQNKNFFILFILLCLQTVTVAAQHSVPDSTLQLKEVVVVAPRISDFTPGYKTIPFDSLTRIEYRQQNLSDLLADESPLFIKSYGLGSLAVASFRGGSAYQTAILWNGISLSSSMNGQLDLSLVPVEAADDIKLQYGGSSTLFGSGAAAGVIHLLSLPEFNKGVTTQLNLSAGSFGDYRQHILIKVSKRKFVSSLKVFNSSATNNFKYTNIYTASGVTVSQTHAELKNWGIISENKLLINHSQTLSINTWLQHTDRNIPPTMLQQESKTHQTDDALRITSEWKYEKKRTTTFVHAAWLNERIIFSDPLSEILDTSKTQQLIGEAETKITLSKTQFINVGIHNTYSSAQHDNYESSPHQDRLALFASYLFTSRNKKLSVGPSVREEFINFSSPFFTYSASGKYIITKWIFVRSNASRVYRIPSFNDLYWVPGGNPNLKSEDGYAEEAGVNMDLKNKTFHFNTDIAVFNRNIENWILWMPGISYWTPQNAMSVWSRGMETNSSLSITIGKAIITVTALTEYVFSTNTKSKTENDNSVGKQLIYVPMYSGMAKATVRYKKFQLVYRHNYVGYRYTSTDNTQYLLPYDLGSLYFSYDLKFSNTVTGIFFRADNIWNEQYQVISNRAMPGINFNGGISIQFHKPNQTK